MRVLFCTDGSLVSYNALKNFSKWSTSNVIVDIICVVDFSFIPQDLFVEDSEFFNYCADYSSNIINHSVELVKSLGFILGSPLKICGSVVDTILEFLNSQHYDCLILGSNGKKGLNKWLGSVSASLVNHSKISNYISKIENNAENVLFAIDNSVASIDFINGAVNLINLKNKNIFLITVFEIPEYLFVKGNLYSGWVSDIEKKQQIEGLLLLSKIEKILLNHGLKVQKSIVANGSISVQILDFAKQNSIDLIVCGNTQKTKFSKIFSDSVTKRLLESTKSDMLIIR